MPLVTTSHLTSNDLTAIICLGLMIAGIFALLAAYVPRGNNSENAAEPFSTHLSIVLNGI
jgi:hypothetical protein